MQQHFRHLVVGRDRAHVKAMLSQFPRAEVMSAADFFERVRYLAFLDDEVVIRDDYAPFYFGCAYLARQKKIALRYARNLASLYSSCYHGGMTPREVSSQVGDDHRASSVLAALRFIDEEMARNSLVNGVSALFQALQIIQKGFVPPSLHGCYVEIFHLIDMTSLEINIIKALSRAGIKFKLCFPMDFHKRGLNVAVDFTARQFECDEALENIELEFQPLSSTGPLEPLVNTLFTDEELTLSHAACSIHIASNVLTEAETIAKKIARILMRSPHDSIAVAVRTMDARAAILARTLVRHGINVKDRKGIALTKTEGGQVLDTLFSAVQYALPKKAIIGLMAHPLSALFVECGFDRAAMIALISDLGVDDRVMAKASSPTARVRNPLRRFKAKENLTDKEMLHVEQLEQWLDRIDAVASQLSAENSFAGYIKSLNDLLSIIFTESENQSLIALRDAILAMSKSIALMNHDDKITLEDFINVIRKELARLTIPPPESADENAVAFLLLPEMLGQHFDHVFIADIVFGRMPQNSAPDPLLNDNDRREINKLVGRPLFRMYQDDPFEPSPTPPRQALEPFWFASSIACAKKSLHFSTATLNELGAEQGPSEFFHWLKDHVHLANDDEDLLQFTSIDHQRFYAGLYDRNQKATSPFLEAISQRERAFFHDSPSPFAFLFEKDHVHELFAGRISATPKRALTPTMIEAFAECRFKGFWQRLLKTSSRPLDFDDVDARAIGQIAHRTLELFFRNKKQRHELGTILATAIKEYCAHNFVGNELVLRCHGEWLEDALLRLIDGLAHARSGTTIAYEIDFGENSAYPSLPIHANGRTYLLGGRVDRIDQEGDRFLIIDYKLSPLDALKASISPKQLLTKNFQMPVYLQLVTHYFARGEITNTDFAYASIRDGSFLPHSFTNNPYEGSLSNAVDAIFAPIVDGAVLATVGDHCTRCDLSFICRKNEVSHGA